MASTLAKSLPDAPRKMLAMRGESASQVACGHRERWGRAIARALDFCDITEKDATYRMGYGTNQAPLSRWIAGTENPQMARLTQALWPDFEQALLVAYARESGTATVRTTIEFQQERRRA